MFILKHSLVAQNYNYTINLPIHLLSFLLNSWVLIMPA